MSAVAEKVEFCERCSRAFDIPVRSHQRICDECRIERKREYNRLRCPPKGSIACILPPEPWMLERRRQGCSYSEIAREAGAPKTTVYRRFQKFS